MASFKVKKLWRNNSLSIVLALVALIFLIGEAVSGWKRQNLERADHDEPPQSLVHYLSDPDFLEATAENWESEFLQMAMYVWLTAFLFQKGSAESKDPEAEDEASNREPGSSRTGAPSVPRRGKWRTTLYENSLSLGLAVLFLVSFLVHLEASRRVFIENERQHGRPDDISLIQYLGHSHFWFESFQNWQSEFVGVLTIVVLSIFLRQRGSPESKPVDARHGHTGTG